MKADGGSAFPVQALASPGSEVAWGMTLRDWFAGKETLADFDAPEASVPKWAAEALAGRQRPNCSHVAKDGGNWIEMLKWEADWRAGLKYIRADAMLRARERGQEVERNDAEEDEAWFREQVNACVYSQPDGSHEAAIDYGSLSWTACGANRAAAIRALRAKVEGGVR